MRTLPILFNTEMVKAILDGRKIVTRRLIKHNTEAMLNSPFHKADPDVSDKQIVEKLCLPPYKQGDVLYVRESVFQGVGHYLDVSGETVSVLTDDFEYYADGQHEKDHWKDKNERTWMHRRPSIHMPKAAARIYLKVKEVRAERLQDITPDQAVREGTKEEFPPLAIDEFRDIWNSTIKKSDIGAYGWDANPWVWVIKFEMCEKPEGEKQVRTEEKPNQQMGG